MLNKYLKNVIKHSKNVEQLFAKCWTTNWNFSMKYSEYIEQAFEKIENKNELTTEDLIKKGLKMLATEF